MASTVNYDDLYEDFVRLSSPSRVEPRAPQPVPTSESPAVKDQSSESLDKSPLRVLTPPSPISDTQSVQNQQQQSQASEQTTYHYLIVATGSGIKQEKMCDSSQGPTTPSIVVTSASGGGASGPISTSGKTLGVDSIAVGNVQSGQTFLPMLLSQQQNHTNLGSIQQGHNGGMENQHPAQSQSHIHPQIHSLQGGPCAAAMQQHLIDGHHHHHVQQLGIAHQHGGHQMGHGMQQSHHVPPHHAHNSPQFMSFGMPFGGANLGSGNGYPGHMNPYQGQHHPPQIPNQQPAHAVSMNLQGIPPACFMQHSTCMHYQPGNPAAVINNQRSHPVNWINGGNQQPPISQQHQNHLGNSFGGSQNGQGKMMTAPNAKMQAAMLPDPSVVPGGLEVLWRELPLDCQKLLMSQDIPDSAKFRGYFTVCELLALKRILESRYAGSTKILPGPPLTPPMVKTTLAKVSSGGVAKEKGQGKRGGPKKSKDKKKSGGGSENGKGNKRQSQQDGGINSTNEGVGVIGSNTCEPEMMQEDTDNSQTGELMISLDSMKQEDIQTSGIPTVTGFGVGGAVKEAMDALVSAAVAPESNSPGHDSTPKESEALTLHAGKETEPEEKSGMDEGQGSNNAPGTEAESEEAGNNNGVLEDLNRPKESTNVMTVLPMLPSMPNFSGLFAEKKAGENGMVTTSSSAPTNGTGSSTDECKEEAGSMAENHKQLVLHLNSMSGKSMEESNTIHYHCVSPTKMPMASANGGCCGSSSIPVDARYNGPPPPYRTATLVTKLLQIGAYQIRSFSNVNPNRLRVLFNNQRIVYECQLPVIASPVGHGAHLTRKVLTVDIGFEQISMIRFGSDSLCMRVDGPPILTMAVNAVHDEPPNQVLSQHDQYLLEQIDKGQLKLSPIHQIFFLNERLVHLLETQFREHPRFRPLLMESNSHGRYGSQ